MRIINIISNNITSYRVGRFITVDDVQRAVLHYVVLYELDGAVLPAVFFLSTGQPQLPDAHGHTRRERAQLPGPRVHRRSLPDQMLHVLHAVGVHQLPIHTRAQHTRGHRRPGPVRHQRVLRVPAVLGHTPRSVRRRPGECVGAISCRSPAANPPSKPNARGSARIT